MSDRPGERDLAASIPGKRDLTASIRELAATLERDLRDHPAPEDLEAFVAGDLPEDQREGIEEHLSLCRACARKVLDLTELAALEPDSKGDLLTDQEIATQWNRFQAAVKPVRHPWPIGALAAVLLVAVVGFATWAVRLSQQPSESRLMNAIDLVPVPQIRGGQEEQQKAQVPGWAKEVSLNLDLVGVETHPEYSLEIKTADGSHVLNLAGARPGSNGAIAVSVPRRSLPAGAYRIRLFSPQKKEVAVYDLLIEP